MTKLKVIQSLATLIPPSGPQILHFCYHKTYSTSAFKKNSSKVEPIVFFTLIRKQFWRIQRTIQNCFQHLVGRSQVQDLLGNINYSKSGPCTTSNGPPPTSRGWPRLGCNLGVCFLLRSLIDCQSFCGPSIRGICSRFNLAHGGIGPGGVEVRVS